VSERERYGKRVPNEREQRVIELVAQGCKNSEVAKALGTTEHVVKNCLRVIYDKLGLWNRVELALWYVRGGSPTTTPPRPLVFSPPG
jgi:DNA-binding NarL/FixJ family response regulator